MSLLEGAGGDWGALRNAIKAFRDLLPIQPLSHFGFVEPPAAQWSELDALNDSNPLNYPNERLKKIGTGVEAWAFEAVGDGSVYKFYRPREGKKIGGEFGYRRSGEPLLTAEACLGDYRGVLEKLLIIVALQGMPTEVIAITPEGILVAKQARGEGLPPERDMSRDLPASLITIPSRFLRADRDHPRLLLLGESPYLVADLHAKNFVLGADGGLHLIDLVAAPWPDEASLGDPLITAWLARVREDPSAGALPSSPDEDL